MTPDQLEKVIAETGHVRYRELTSDANPDAWSREDARRQVERLAGEKPIPLSATVRATRLGFGQCWFSTKDDECGCSGLRCHLKGRIVGLRDCVACLA